VKRQLEDKTRSFRQATAVAAAALVLFLLGCERNGQPSAAHSEITAIAVRVVVAERIRSPGSQAVAGTARPLERALIAARVTGSIADANFTLGQSVTAGDVLLLIQADELRARLEQARAALNQATRDLTRETTLQAQGSSTEENVRTARDRVQMTQAAFEEAQTLLSYARITAPFSGHVTQKLVNSGDLATPGTPLLEIEAPDRIRAELEVPETLPSLPIGAEVRVTSERGTITGRIVETSSATNPTTRTRRVIVALPSDTSIHSGEFVRGLWPTGESEMILVPVDTVRLFGQIERVFLVEEGRAVMRVVKTGARVNDRIQIISGLSSGEAVIVSPPVALRDGVPVRVQP
jgi:membrane fusion protein (multidrug efflux system)